jgi:uroporphyrin-III C-methyltransferase
MHMHIRMHMHMHMHMHTHMHMHMHMHLSKAEASERAKEIGAEESTAAGAVAVCPTSTGGSSACKSTK